jgi:hypothetical protein
MDTAGVGFASSKSAISFGGSLYEADSCAIVNKLMKSKDRQHSFFMFPDFGSIY